MTCPEFHLTPEALLPEITLSEQERAAIDHTINAMKKSGVYDRQRDAAAHREELNDRRTNG